MMFDQMQAMLNRNSQALLSGETGEIAMRCHYPMVIHAPNRVVPFHTAKDYAATLKHMSQRMREDFKVTDIVVRLRTMDLPRHGRFRAWATMSYVFAVDMPPRTTQLTYYCRAANGQIKVEMVEMDCDGLPDQPIRGQAA
jgi:hypothetical protein